MRSPWKLIAGLIYRGGPATSHELATDILAIPDRRDEESCNQAAGSPEREKSHHPASVPLLEEASKEQPIGPSDSLEPLSSLEMKPIPSGVLEDGVEPVLAMTIGLVTKDSSSVRVGPPSTSVVPDMSAASIVGEKKNDTKIELINPSSWNSEAEAASKADSRSEHTATERANINDKNRGSGLVECRQRGIEPPDPPMNNAGTASDAVVGKGFIPEMASLDNAINELRDQLAQKLRLQNQQLTLMLARMTGGEERGHPMNGTK